MKIDRMTKEDFIKNLMKIKQDHLFYSALSDTCRKYKREDDINIFPNSYDISIKLLEIAIGDKYEYVSWWIFEKEWGNKGEDFCVTDHNGNVIPTETMSDIYDLVTKNIEADLKDLNADIDLEVSYE